MDQIGAWKAEHPLVMKEKPIMTPQDVIGAINRLFDEAIIITDVRTASDVYRAVC